ncbi:DUF2442 domain-containing protein [Crenothrix sp.]|uniref:DUF2442 domain-containing protein n=1 Tax=Crenothrix sp. TaxID=3100433 RepID=UPI00374D6260
MNYPKIHDAKAINHHVLAIEFNNGEKKRYDITPLLKNEMFLPLQNPDFFKNVQVEKGGYAVYWNEEIDISEYELWIHGESQ